MHAWRTCWENLTQGGQQKTAGIISLHPDFLVILALSNYRNTGQSNYICSNTLLLHKRYYTIIVMQTLMDDLWQVRLVFDILDEQRLI
jgi:hypothetical protein